MYRNNAYTAKMLADDLDTNLRYLSRVLAGCYGMNYKTLVNKLRIEEAMDMLGKEEYDGINMEDIGTAVGFMNKQSFFAYFTKVTGTTPLKYRNGIRRHKNSEEQNI